MNKRIVKKINRERAMSKIAECISFAMQTMKYPPAEYEEQAQLFFEAIKCGNRLDANDVLWGVCEDNWYVIDSDDILMYPLPSRKFSNFLDRSAMRRIRRRNMKHAGDGFTLGELRYLFPDR